MEPGVTEFAVDLEAHSYRSYQGFVRQPRPIVLLLVGAARTCHQTPPKSRPLRRERRERGESKPKPTHARAAALPCASVRGFARGRLPTLISRPQPPILPVSRPSFPTGHGARGNGLHHCQRRSGSGAPRSRASCRVLSPCGCGSAGLPDAGEHTLRGLPRRHAGASTPAVSRLFHPGNPGTCSNVPPAWVSHGVHRISCVDGAGGGHQRARLLSR